MVKIRRRKTKDKQKTTVDFGTMIKKINDDTKKVLDILENR